MIAGSANDHTDRATNQPTHQEAARRGAAVEDFQPVERIRCEPQDRACGIASLRAEDESVAGSSDDRPLLSLQVVGE
jgi:hypothetical protein